MAHCVARSQCASHWRGPRRAPVRECVAIIVPYRPQAEQDRTKQLHALLRHLPGFAATATMQVLLIVVQQADDGRKFNRGQLLNIGAPRSEPPPILDPQPARRVRRIRRGSAAFVGARVGHFPRL